MSPAEIRVRRCGKMDLLDATRLALTAVNDLRRRTGKEIHLRRAAEPSPLIRHIHETDPELLAAAWAGDRMVGFTGAMMRGRQWFLAWLFVHPRWQDRGIGKRLLRKVWRDGPGMVHSLCTMTYNMQAVGLYSTFGMVPEEMITVMKASPERARLPERNGWTRSLDPTLADIAWINKLEKKIRGYARPEEWDFWGNEYGGRIAIFREKGRRVAYGMLDERDFLAPVGAARPADLVPAVAEMIRLAREEKREDVLLFCPTRSRDLYRFLIRAGLRNEEMLLFQSDAPYGDFSRYVPATLAFF